MVIRLLHHKLVEQRIADLRSTAVRSMPAKRSERTIASREWRPVEGSCRRLVPNTPPCGHRDTFTKHTLNRLCRLYPHSS